MGEIFIIKGPGRITRREFYEHYRSMLHEPAELVLLKPGEYKKIVRKQKYGAMRSLMPATLSALKADDDFRKVISKSGVVKPLKLLRGLRPKRKSTGPPSSGANSTAEKPLILPPALFYAKYLAAETEYSNQKAKDLLGFAPVFDIERGMGVTETWANWARIIKSPSDTSR